MKYSRAGKCIEGIRQTCHILSRHVLVPTRMIFLNAVRFHLLLMKADSSMSALHCHSRA